MENMEGYFVLEYSTISRIIEEYYRRKHPNNVISCRVYYTVDNHPDGWGGYDEYYDIEACVKIHDKKKVLGQEIDLQRSEYLSHNEIFKIMEVSLEEVLENEGNGDISLSKMFVEKNYVEFNIVKKNKTNERVLKKVND